MVVSFAVHAQDSLSVSSHYFGVQVNQLLRQIFSLSNSQIASNPYLLNYSYNGATGVGINIGLGYQVDQFKNSDAFTDRETENSDLSLRIGPEKKSFVGKKLMVSVGMDFIVSRAYNKTKQTNKNDFIESRVTSENKISGIGFGPRMSLNYFITDKIVVGTELNYYFRSLKNKRSFNSFTKFEGNPPEVQTDDGEDKTKHLTFGSPAVITLMVRF